MDIRTGVPRAVHEILRRMREMPPIIFDARLGDRECLQLILRADGKLQKRRGERNKSGDQGDEDRRKGKGAPRRSAPIFRAVRSSC